MRLLVRPQPNPGDSLAGYLMTVANRNGMSFAQWCGMLDLSERAFHNPGDVMYGRSAPTSFEKSIGLTPNTLSPMVYATDRTWKRPSHVRYLGMQVPFVLMRGASAPVCPLCLAEKRVPEADWDLVLHTACVQHRLQLVMHCPACTKPLQWLRSRVDSCPCGFELQDCPQTVVSEVIRFSDQQELMQVAMLVAFKVADATGTLRLDALRDLPMGILDAMVTAATKAIRADTDSLTTLLLDIAKRRAEQNGALGQRWPLLPVLIGLKDEPAVSDWLREYSEALSVQADNAQLNIEALSLAETAVLLEVSEHVVKQCCVKGLLKKLSDRTGQTPMLICAQSVAQYLANPPPKSPAPLRRVGPPGTMTVIEAAKQLGIYPDAIRRVIKADLLPSQKGIGTQVLLQGKDVAEFQQTYVFVKELAAAWETNHTNLAERLMAVGVKPVSGPAVDGGLVYLFRRADVNEDIRELACSLSGYPTRAGRKAAGKYAEKLSGYLTAQQVADELGISVPQVAQLVANDYLQESRPEGITSNRRYIRRDMLTSYRCRYRDNPSLAAIEEAASVLNLTIGQLQTRHLMNGELQVVTDGISRYLLRTEVAQLQAKLRELISAADACKLLGAPAYFLNNLVKIGQLVPAHHHGLQTGSEGRVRHFFRLQDIENLKDRRSAGN